MADRSGPSTLDRLVSDETKDFMHPRGRGGARRCVGRGHFRLRSKRRARHRNSGRGFSYSAGSHRCHISFVIRVRIEVLRAEILAGPYWLVLSDLLVTSGRGMPISLEPVSQLDHNRIEIFLEGQATPVDPTVSLSSLAHGHCRRLRAGPRTTAQPAWLLPLAASTGSRLQVPRHSSSTHRGWP